MIDSILQSITVGLITGVFSAGAIYGVLKTELRFMRRDIDEVRHYLWPDRRKDDKVYPHSAGIDAPYKVE